MTFQTALAALERIEAAMPATEDAVEDVERLRVFVERVELLASAAAHIIEGTDKTKTVHRVTAFGLRDVLRGSA